jgi:hypothetical protein
VFARHSKVVLAHRLTSPRSIVDRAHAVKKGESMFIERPNAHNWVLHYEETVSCELPFDSQTIP